MALLLHTAVLAARVLRPGGGAINGNQGQNSAAEKKKPSHRLLLKSDSQTRDAVEHHIVERGQPSDMPKEERRLRPFAHRAGIHPSKCPAQFHSPPSASRRHWVSRRESCPRIAIFARSIRPRHLAHRSKVHLHSVRLTRIGCLCRLGGRRAIRLHRSRWACHFSTSARSPVPLRARWCRIPTKQPILLVADSDSILGSRFSRRSPMHQRKLARPQIRCRRITPLLRCPAESCSYSACTHIRSVIAAAVARQCRQATRRAPR